MASKRIGGLFTFRPTTASAGVTLLVLLAGVSTFAAQPARKAAPASEVTTLPAITEADATTGSTPDFASAEPGWTIPVGRSAKPVAAPEGKTRGKAAGNKGKKTTT